MGTLFDRVPGLLPILLASMALIVALCYNEVIEVFHIYILTLFTPKAIIHRIVHIFVYERRCVLWIEIMRSSGII